MASPAGGPPSEPSAVTDEELVHAISVGREAFLKSLAAYADGRLLELALRDVRPASSIRLELTFSVERADSDEVLAGVAAAVILAVEQLLETALRTPIAVSAALETPATQAADPTPSSGWDKVAPVLTAIGTGIGVIGFVTFIGGVIVWGRLNGAGLPAAPALSVFPTQDLLVAGAQTLVPELLAALGVVAALATVYVGARRLFHRVGQAEERWLTGKATRLIAGGMFVFAAIALFVTLLPYIRELSPRHTQFAFAAIAGGALLAAVIASVTRRFVYLAVTSFVLVAVFMSCVAYWKARDDDQVRGAAVIRTDRITISGIWLTEGSGRVYLAKVVLGRDHKIIGKKSRIIGVDKSVVSDLAIAGAQPAATAVADADHLATELCALHPPSGAKADAHDCAGDPLVPPKPPAVAPPKITPYAGPAGTLDADGAVLIALPALAEDAIGVVSFVTRDQVWMATTGGARRREQFSVSTKPFRAEAGRSIHVRVHLSRRARRAMDEAGGALAVRLRVVAIGTTGAAGRDDHGCIVLRRRGAHSTAHC